MIDISNMQKLNKANQKQRLQEILELLYGSVEAEKKYDWCKPPKYGEGYDEIINAIKSVRGYEFINNYMSPLRFDYACEQQKLIIEYDERQHFTPQRKVSLLAYPEDVKTYYDRNLWIKLCEQINTHMNKQTEANRDEKRAFYEAVRDIEAYRNGYMLVRIYHGQINLENRTAEKELRTLIANSETGY